MTSNHWRSYGCFVPKDPIEKKRYLKELVFATMINNTPHPASKKLSERVREERAGQANHEAALNHPPLPQHMAEQRTEQERQAWRDYYATHHIEYDHYKGHSPTRRHGGIWTGD